MEKNPNAVECSPVLNYGDNSCTYIGTVGANKNYLPGYQNCLVGDWLYFLGPFLYDTSGVYLAKDIRRYNVKTGVYETVANVETNTGSKYGYKEMCGCAVDGVCYFFGGLHYTGSTSDYYENYKVFAYDTNTGELTTYSFNNIAGIDPTSKYTCCAIGSKIYLFGALDIPDNVYSSRAYVFDTISKTFSGFNMASGYGCSCCPLGDKIYIFGGYGSSNYSVIRQLDINSLTWTKKSATLPYAFTGSTPSVAYGNKIYLFGNNASSSGMNKVCVYDTQTDTIENLGDLLNGGVNGTCWGTDGLNVYFLGGGGYSTNSSQPQKFSIQTALQANNLFLQADFGFDNPFPIVSDKNAKITAYLRNAYLGDSNNIAQPTNAYLYDTNTNQWKSLSGESYVADMQTALNILGVT